VGIHFARAGSRRLQKAWLTRGPLACSLLPLAGIYALLSGALKLLYQVGVLKTSRLEVPVVVVGNLVVGGAGKTPTVLALVDLLRRHGYTPGILSRGYGRQGVAAIDVRADTSAALSGDEPKLLHLRSAAPVLVGRDRVAAGQELLRRHPEVDVIVSDDGLQHHALARDVQVVVFDERGVGNGWLLPAGPLRERLATAIPPRTLVLYNAAQPSTNWPGGMGERRLTGVVELAKWQRGIGASPESWAALRGRPLLAAAGIAHPQRFFSMLRQQGLAFDTLALPDHFGFAALPWPATTPDVVLTEKDAVKIDPARVGATRVWVAALDFRLGPTFEGDLIKLLPARCARRR
jgi:tetraacyldisaccharide 4'-kinase